MTTNNNPCIWKKISENGISDDLERRMKELDKTGTPLPFECFYAVEIDESVAPKIEKKIHEA